MGTMAGFSHQSRLSWQLGVLARTGVYLGSGSGMASSLLELQVNDGMPTSSLLGFQSGVYVESNSTSIHAWYILVKPF
jgi:hypothetical protein